MIDWVRAGRCALAGAALALLGACASVPDLDRYLLHVDPERVRLDSSRGVLTSAQSQRIIEGLQKRAPGSDVLDRHIAIEEAITGTPLTTGNKVVLLEDGRATYAAMLKAIRAAKHHVHFEMYIFEGDEVGREFADAMMERRRAGVTVRLIYDAVGSSNTPKEFFKEMEDAGVQVLEFNPVTAAAVLSKGTGIQNRDHRKLVLVDGRIAFIGGINISSVYGGMSGPLGSGGRASASGTRIGSRGDPTLTDERPWRDLQAQIEGPVVADFQKAFAGHWEKYKKEKIEGAEYFPVLTPQGPLVVRAMADSPSENGVSLLYVALISAIDHADLEVRIINAYFVPHPQLREALQRAARRGVEVRLILPGRSDVPLVYYAGRSYYEELLAAGVRIYERKSRVLHAKSATVDKVWTTVGSTNLDWRSLLYNEELNAVILGSDFAGQANAVFDKDLAHSDEITLAGWKARPFSERLKEAAATVWAQLL
jgi:cardiolipin synthase